MKNKKPLKKFFNWFRIFYHQHYHQFNIIQKKIYLFIFFIVRLSLIFVDLTRLLIYSIITISITIMIFFYRVNYFNISQMIFLLKKFKRFDFFFDVQNLIIKKILIAINQIIIDNIVSIMIMMKKTNFDKQIIWLYFKFSISIINRRFI